VSTDVLGALAMQTKKMKFVKILLLKDLLHFDPSLEAVKPFLQEAMSCEPLLDAEHFTAPPVVVHAVQVPPPIWISF
jgi:hypothetical protein